MNLKYLLGAPLIIPCLPIIYLQGKRIRKEVPELPEAVHPSGLATPDQLKSDRPFRLITIGESTIAGVGVQTHEEGFSGTIAKELAQQLGRPVSWRVYAKSGYTAKRKTFKLVPKIEEKELDLILIGTGGNDAFHLTTPQAWRQAIHELIQSIREKFPETPVAFLNMPPIKTFPAFTSLIKFSIGNLVEILGEELEKITNAYPKVYYNAEIISPKGWPKKLGIEAAENDFFSDGVHPSKLTYQLWAKDFCQYMVKEKELWHTLKE